MGGGYLKSNMTGYFCDFIYEFGYTDIYDHIIQYGGCSPRTIKKEAEKNKIKISIHLLLGCAETNNFSSKDLPK